MQIVTFEEKAAEFIKENVLCEGVESGTMFRVQYSSLFRSKELQFEVLGKKPLFFMCRGETWDELFDRALKVLKGYVTQTRERKVDTTSENAAQ